MRRRRQTAGTRLPEKVAVITGGASGIGAAIAHRFAAEGARQVLVGLPGEEEKARDLIAAMAEETAVFVAGDITDPATAERAVDTAMTRFGRLDILVNNAGIDYSGVALLDSEPAFSRRVMDVNFFGALYMLLAAARAMLRSVEFVGGAADGTARTPGSRTSPTASIVTVASRAGVVGVPTMAVYGATKAALISLTRTAALELAPLVRVNAVAPGATGTPMMRTWIDGHEDPQQFERSLAATIPLGRLAHPEEIAAAVLFLAGDEAAHITGAVLPVDGGYTTG